MASQQTSNRKSNAMNLDSKRINAINEIKRFKRLSKKKKHVHIYMDVGTCIIISSLYINTTKIPHYIILAVGYKIQCIPEPLKCLLIILLEAL